MGRLRGVPQSHLHPGLWSPQPLWALVTLGMFVLGMESSKRIDEAEHGSGSLQHCTGEPLLLFSVTSSSDVKNIPRRGRGNLDSSHRAIEGFLWDSEILSNCPQAFTSSLTTSPQLPYETRHGAVKEERGSEGQVPGTHLLSNQDVGRSHRLLGLTFAHLQNANNNKPYRWWWRVNEPQK